MKRIIRLAIDDEDGWATILEAIRYANLIRQGDGEKIEAYRGRVVAAICGEYLDLNRSKPSGEAKP